MGFKSKAMVAVIAAAAISAVGVASASAETGGHFTFDTAHTLLKESKEAGHSFELKNSNEEAINCSQAIGESTVNATTLTELQLTPTYSGCKTSGGAEVTATMEGCSYVFTIGKDARADNTVDLTCPSGKALELHHPNCTMTIPPQTGKLGAAFTEVIESAKRALTMELTVSALTVQYHGGICILLGTNQLWKINGSFKLAGWNTVGEPTAIRATGSENVEFKTETAHTAVTGASSSSMSFGILLGTVECSTASLDGTTAATEYSELTVNPAYSGCKGSGREVTTHTNGCAYVLTVTGPGTDGRVDIECPAGKSIETTIDKFPEGCTITIPAQTAGGVVDYEEKGEGTGRDLLLTWTLEGLDYTRDGCEVGGTGTNGTMGGSITLSGEDTSGNPKGIWIE